MGIIMAPGILRTTEFHNHWAYSFQIKFIGTVFCVLACIGLYVYNVMVICPSAHNGHAHGHENGSWNLVAARTQQPIGRFTPNQFIGTDLACRCATTWLFAHGGIMDMPMGMKRAPGILRLSIHPSVPHPVSAL